MLPVRTASKTRQRDPIPGLLVGGQPLTATRVRLPTTAAGAHRGQPGAVRCGGGSRSPVASICSRWPGLQWDQPGGAPCDGAGNVGQTVVSPLHPAQISDYLHQHVVPRPSAPDSFGIRAWRNCLRSHPPPQSSHRRPPVSPVCPTLGRHLGQFEAELPEFVEFVRVPSNRCYETYLLGSPKEPAVLFQRGLVQWHCTTFSTAF